MHYGERRLVRLPIRIHAITPGSPADRAGICPEDLIGEINGEPVLDEIDYQALSASERLTVQVLRDGQEKVFEICKKDWEPLGLCLDEREALKSRHCRNHCLFCFVDQLPEGMRDTLYVKDDDWRLSLMMGNYVTLTNVNDQEFERILKRKASPLYISVHATEPAVRCKMLNNPQAGMLMERLTRLRETGLQFHCQIVLCPGINDGMVLERSIEDIASLYPAAQSIAIVPVGITKHRQNLPKLKIFDKDTAHAFLCRIQTYQQRFLRQFGTRFVFPSDEFYCISGDPLPDDLSYEGYPQIENGVGMLRLLETECEEAYEDLEGDLPVETKPRKILIPTGVSAQPFIRNLAERYAPSGTEVEVIAVENRFFGKTITVTGLIVGQDLIHTLKGRECDEILICDTMLRESSDRFLDDMTLQEVRDALNKPVRVVRNNGGSLIRALYGMEDPNDY